MMRRARKQFTAFQQQMHQTPFCSNVLVPQTIMTLNMSHMSSGRSVQAQQQHVTSPVTPLHLTDVYQPKDPRIRWEKIDVKMNNVLWMMDSS